MLRITQRLLLLVLPAILLSIFVPDNRTHAWYQQNLNESQSQPELMAYYKDFNKRYFGGKLPSKHVYLDWGLTTRTWVTHYEDEPEITEISIGAYLKLHPKSVCMHIFHEMAHLAVRISHPNLAIPPGDDTDKDDVLFQEEMQRLARIGAFRECW